MTALVERALHATGLLAEFNEAGVLTLADVHTARRVALLGGEPDEMMHLAIALTVRALRMGSVCIDLVEISRTTAADEDVDVSSLPWPDPAEWQAACLRSPVVSADGQPGRPLRRVRGLLYLDRYWREEEQVRRQLQQRAAAPPPQTDPARLRADLDRLFQAGHSKQRLAAAVSALRWVTVLAGGPGTGKTTTIARLLAVLCAQPGDRPRIALAAPTGKAAARLEEAVREVTRSLPEADRAALGDLHASTLHRLLGRRPGSRTRFRHNGSHRLPYDVVVVDETSMVSLTLMARLIEAVRPDARLILVGDPDQLTSVEAGAVLGDIVAAAGLPEPALHSALHNVGETATVTNGVVTLEQVWRFGRDIAALANAVRAGDDDTVVALLRDSDQLEFVESPAEECLDLRTEMLTTLQVVTQAAERGDAAAALRGLEAHRLLCAHRRGPYGVTHWTAATSRWLAAPDLTEWVPGRPLLITANDYDAGLYNGDTGVIIRTPDGSRAAVARGGDIALIPPSRLSEAQPLYAMTVHRSQGSQFNRVSLLLPPATSPLLTRELFYTAVTRAQSGLRILGTEEAVRAAVTRPIARASGLRDSLAGPAERAVAEVAPAVTPTAQRREAVYIEHRRVYIVNGTKTQTVNVCMTSNQKGDCEVAYRLPSPELFVTEADLAGLGSLGDLRQWLLDRGAEEEERGGRPLIKVGAGAQSASQTAGSGDAAAADGSLRPPRSVTASMLGPGSVASDPSWSRAMGGTDIGSGPTLIDKAWLTNATRTTELAIDALVWEFVEHPYLHRVEHSLHARLFDILAAHPLFAHLLPIGSSGQFTQPVHKEWPETVPRPEKGGRRGAFDLAVLNRAQLATATVEDFAAGLVPASIVIELGLNYSLDHLTNDHWKLVNSRVESGFLVHFSRNRRRDLEVERYLLDPRRQYRAAYAHHEPGGWCTFKTLDGELQRVRTGQG